MTTTSELVDAICVLLERPGPPVPITLSNHLPDEAHGIIADVIERSATNGVSVTEVSLDPEFAHEMQLRLGDRLSANAPAKVALVGGLGRQVLFTRAVH